jgi:hypothetical protein
VQFDNGILDLTSVEEPLSLSGEITQATQVTAENLVETEAEVRLEDGFGKEAAAMVETAEDDQRDEIEPQDTTNAKLLEEKVKVIQRAWRACRVYVPKDALDADRYQLTKDCRKHARSVGWSQSGPRAWATFIICLPRLLLCLRWILFVADKRRKKLQTRRQNADLDEKYELMERLADIK